MKARFITDNFWLKLASVLLAVIMWFFVLFRSQVEVSMEVTPTFKQAPEALSVVEVNPEAVTVLLKGNERILGRLRPSDIKLVLNLKEGERGKTFIPIERDDIKTPPHVSPVSYKPTGIWVVLESTVKLTLPVRPDILGQPGQGYAVERIEVMPDMVEVEGAGEEMKSSHLTTEPIDISGLTATLAKDVRIKAPAGAALKPEQVKVRITIRRLLR